MTKEQDRTVYPTEDGRWADKRNSAERAAAIFDTQEEAIASARTHLLNSGGGELTVMGEDGQIRSKDTLGEANDPFPPRDTEH